MCIGIENSISIKKTIGIRLKAARESYGYTRDELCEHLNKNSMAPTVNSILQPDTLKQWEFGNNAINIAWIPAICAVLKCDTGYLFGEYETKTKEKADIQIKTGLSEEAIEKLLSWGYEFPAIRTILSHLIESSHFYDMMDSLHSAIRYSLPEGAKQLKNRHTAIMKMGKTGQNLFPFKSIDEVDDLIQDLADYSPSYVVVDMQTASKGAVHEAQNMFIRVVDEMMGRGDIGEVLQLSATEPPISEERIAQVWEQLKSVCKGDGDNG